MAEIEAPFVSFARWFSERLPISMHDSALVLSVAPSEFALSLGSGSPRASGMAVLGLVVLRDGCEEGF